MWLRLTIVLALCVCSGCSGCKRDPNVPVGGGSGRDGAAAAQRGFLAGSHIRQVKALAQNWTDAEASEFYNLSQGARILPYDWLLHLEQPGTSSKKFLDAEFIRSLGYLPRSPDPGNEDGLPVGFVKDAKYDDGAAAVGLTCAACHTSQVEHDGIAYIIDGAGTLGDVQSLLTAIEKALDETNADDARFDRFAEGVLGSSPAAAAKAQLRTRLGQVLAQRRGYNERNMPAAGASPFGHGRVDAFGAILNEVTVQFMQQPGNVKPADAPVSYPFLWDTPQHDKVQWNGAAENTRNSLLRPLLGTEKFGALGRNVGEVLGVFGHTDLAAAPTFLRGYPSTVNSANLIRLEELVETLWSPQWPAEFGPLDADLKAKGQVLYDKHCLACHAVIRRDDPNRKANEEMNYVKTDSTMAKNFALRTAQSGLLSNRSIGILPFPRFGDTASGKDALTHTVLQVILGARSGPESAPESESAELTAALAGYRLQVNAQVEVEGATIKGSFDRIEVEDGEVKALVGDDVRIIEGEKSRKIKANPKTMKIEIKGAGVAELAPSDVKGIDLEVAPRGVGPMAPGPEAAPADPPVVMVRPRASAAVHYEYKARPLNGIWATAPYLHNGSVPNLDELLQAVDMRSATFKVGSRKMDTTRVGLAKDDGPFEYDTRLPGNSNAGHEFGKNLSDDERKQLLEYLKSL